MLSVITIVIVRFLVDNISMKRRRVLGAANAFICAFIMLSCPLAHAAQSNSSNYSVDQVFMGSGGELNACSATYCAKQSAGEVAAGHTAGAAFQAQAGFNVNREPYLAFSVSGNASDLGYLSTFGTATTTGTFAVKTYLAGGYVVQIASDPPTNTGPSAHQITPLGSPTGPAVGVEQFGINLVANTSPSSFGAPPVQIPDNTFSYGSVVSGYNTANQFKYNKGDVVAQSTQSTGQTDYTVSFIYNISDVTPDGQYNYNGVFVATSTF
jgi:hypothetical protein